MPPERSVIIIGGGLAGLSAGCYARMNGYQAHIFEHGSIPGGVCTSWKRKGYMIDGCIHWLMGHKPGNSLYTFYRELGTAQANKFNDVTSYANYLDEKSGKQFHITSNMEEVKEKLLQISPEDRKAIEEFFRACLVLGKMEISADKPIEIQNFFEKLLSLLKMGRVAIYAMKYGMTVEEYVRRFKNEWIKKIILNLFLQDMPAVFVMMILGYLFQGQLGTVEGGSLKFVLPIEKRFKALGGKITYNSTVDKILVENDAAVGIKLADGTTHRADIVISAADLHSTLFNMLDGRYITERFENMFQRWKMFTPVILATFGINGKIKQYPPTNVIFLKEPLNVGGKAVDMIGVRDFSYDSTLAPQGKTVIQAEFESSFDHWNGLHANQEQYDKEKELVAREVLKRLENYYPGITGKVEMTDIATPYTFWRYTRNHRGAFEGWLMTKESLMYPVEKILPGLKNFYLAGQWVEPGGGVPTAVWSGRKIIQILCHNEKKKFVTSFPD